MININDYIKEDHLQVKVKPNSNKTEILDVIDNVVIISLKAIPEEGKANIELIKFIKKLTGKNAEIIKGKKTKTKILRLY